MFCYFSSRRKDVSFGSGCWFARKAFAEWFLSSFKLRKHLNFLSAGFYPLFLCCNDSHPNSAQSVHYSSGPESSFVILTSYLSYLSNHIDAYHKVEKQNVLNLDQLIPQQIQFLGLLQTRTPNSCSLIPAKVL